MTKAPIIADIAAMLALPNDDGWKPFRPGIEIYQIHGKMGQPGPSAALLRYQPGAKVPRHTHRGWEHIFVLDGAQTDDHGTHPAGTLLASPDGTSHAIVSDQGCVVLAIYEQPVEMAED